MKKETNLDKLIKIVNKELHTIKSGDIYEFVSKPEIYTNINTHIIKHLVTKKKMSGIYVTLKHPHKKIEKHLKQNKINTKNITFIDGTGSSKKRSKNHIPLGNNKSLMELSLAITKACRNNQHRFIFMDSITTLLLYNDAKTTNKFIQYLVNRVKNINDLSIILSIDEEKSKKLKPSLSKFFKKNIIIK